MKRLMKPNIDRAFDKLSQNWIALTIYAYIYVYMRFFKYIFIYCIVSMPMW